MKQLASDANTKNCTHEQNYQNSGTIIAYAGNHNGSIHLDFRDIYDLRTRNRPTLLLQAIINKCKNTNTI